MYINDGVSGFSVANGDYAATLYGKDTGNSVQPNLSDVKAKSKNFKVNCPPQSVVAQAPTRVDVCGRQNDTYTIPAVTGVIYKIGGVVTAAGTYATTANTVTVTAEAAPGYALTGKTSWPLSFTNNNPCPVVVTPTAPTMNDVCGALNDTYTIPAQTGVRYYVNGSIIERPAGTYPANPIFPYYIKAVAASGYQLSGDDDWLFNFNGLPCLATPAAPVIAADECGTANDSYTIPATTGVRYFVNGVEKPAGTYKGNGLLIILAVPEIGYIIHPHAQHLWFLGFTNVKCPDAVTPTVPTHLDECGTGNDTYTIPAMKGIKYQVNGVDTPAGTYPATGTVTITAIALPGYIIPANTPATWNFDFTNVACPASDITVIAECAPSGVKVLLTNNGTADGYATVNGVKVNVIKGQSVEVTVPFTLFKADVKVYDDAKKLLLDTAFNCPLGMGSIGGASGNTVATTPAEPATVVTSSVKNSNELPTTGGINVTLQTAVMVLFALTAYGATYYFQGRRLEAKSR